MSEALPYPLLDSWTNKIRVSWEISNNYGVVTDETENTPNESRKKMPAFISSFNMIGGLSKNINGEVTEVDDEDDDEETSEVRNSLVEALNNASSQDGYTKKIMSIPGSGFIVSYDIRDNKPNVIVNKTKGITITSNKKLLSYLPNYQFISLDEGIGRIKHMGFKGNVIWDKNKPDGQFKKPASNKKLLSYLPNYQFISLDEGIGRTIEWFKDNYPNIRK